MQLSEEQFHIRMLYREQALKTGSDQYLSTKTKLNLCTVVGRDCSEGRDLKALVCKCLCACPSLTSIILIKVK